MQCELCGREIIGKPVKVWVEGAYLTVCNQCARYGLVVKQKPQAAVHRQATRQVRAWRTSDEIMVVSDYSTVIRQARERMGLTQSDLAKMIGEKESIIRRLESGRMSPTLDLARKLEKALKVKLIERVEASRGIYEVPRPATFQLTLGDVAIIKERRRGKS
ncbi:MAG: TIGR00270 family protein [Thermoprotei archaeon]|nr:MAG: TIGR00270 family protein [Thermoprotei archaeon]RLF22085.1 MAG: TIGR00270 family protein [Thermoprotei archaeon]